MRPIVRVFSPRARCVGCSTKRKHSISLPERLDADVTINEYPTWLLDAVMGMNGLLGDALGANVTATVNSRNFSADSGQLEATATAANASTVSAKLSGRNGAFRTARR